MQVKLFTFPSFEEWIEKYNRKYTQRIGAFTCHIGLISSTLKNHKPYSNTFGIAISTANMPTNAGAYKLYCSTKQTLVEDNQSLKEWYDTVVKDVNRAWNEYILSTYLQEE